MPGCLAAWLPGCWRLLARKNRAGAREQRYSSFKHVVFYDARALATSYFTMFLKLECRHSRAKTPKNQKKFKNNLVKNLIWNLKRGPQTRYACACPPSNSPQAWSLKPAWLPGCQSAEKQSYRSRVAIFELQRPRVLQCFGSSNVATPERKHRKIKKSFKKKLKKTDLEP